MPNDEIDRAPLDKARAALANAARTRRRLTREAAAGATRLERLLRAHGSRDERVVSARAEYEALTRALDRAGRAAVQARRDLAGRRREWLADDAAGDVARLGADFPLLLVPVRLETRFDAGAQPGPALKVRIYPDTILSDTHDVLLTNVEADAGRLYWESAWAGDEAAAWRDLTRQTPAARAAWIVKTTEPTNIAERPEGLPVFPDIELKAESWDQAPVAPLLPDRWIVVAYRDGAEVHRAVTEPVEEPLALWFDPHTPPGEGIDVSGDGLVLDEPLQWTVDFARAEAAGMAVSLGPLSAQDLQRGFDRIVVFGVRASLAPEPGQEAFARLLDAHHYTHGLALVPQGTPTNNTDLSSTPFPPSDPDGSHSFAIERGPDRNTDDGDGGRLMRAFGLPSAVVARVEGANRTEQVAARAMNQAVWPATWGYYLEEMMAPHLGPAAVAEARTHFVDHVRGRGPLPAFRIRGLPYGVLPASSLDRWQPRPGAAGAGVHLPALLRRLRPIWQAAVDRVPRVGRTADADADLLEALGMDASAREVRVRRVNGRDFQANLFAFLSLDMGSWEAAHVEIVRPLMSLIGQPAWNPRILGMTFVEPPGRFRQPFVAPGPASEQTGLEAAFGFDYIRWIREATIDDLREERVPEGRQVPNTLLYRMLRHARLSELRRVAVDLEIMHGQATEAERHEPELVGIAPATAGRPIIWQRFDRPIPPLTGQKTLGAFLVENRDVPETATLQEYDAALEALEGLPTAELERLFTETLDLCSHRIDAWITSLATKRLTEMREANPLGAYVGAYGFVEGLVPSTAPVREMTLDDGRRARVVAGNAGYMQAPSMQHASAAAVLRSGHLTRSGEQSAPYAVNLSSARVRAALRLMDAVRDGQPVGAILGYAFERGLHDRRLDWFIEPLRRRFPIVANKAGDPDLEGPPDLIAARSVVDGLALRNAWRAGTLDLTHADFFRAGNPATETERAGVEAELQHLDDAVDAAADLLMAESVFQIVGGDAGAANAGLDAMAKGARPPDPQIAHAPRTGIPLAHRVGIVIGGDPLPTPEWLADPTPRSRAEPYVDGFAGTLLGDPARVQCRVRVTSAADERLVRLSHLRLRPIDVLAMARARAEGPAPLSELDERVAEAALANEPAGASVEAIVYARHESWPRDEVRTFPEALEVARAINALVGNARPLARADLVPPDAVPLLTPDTTLDAETLERAEEARTTLDQVGQALGSAIASADAGARADGLRMASLFGIPGAFPRGDAASDLVAQASAAVAEIGHRVSAAIAAGDAAAIARAVFGREFPFVPRFVPAQPDELRQALAAGPAIAGAAHAVTTWMYQAARVRPALAKWRTVALLTGALGTRSGTLAVAQLPHREGARWAALPFEPGGEPRAGTLSLLFDRLASPEPEQPWAGLLLDEWDEVIPANDVTTGISFHFDAPGSEAPQSVLVAVPPANAAQWELDGVLAILNETLDLAKVRAVDGELLGAIGQLLPAVFLSVNAAGDSVSTTFAGSLVLDQVLTREG